MHDMRDMHYLIVPVFHVRDEYWNPINKSSTRAAAKLQKRLALAKALKKSLSWTTDWHFLENCRSGFTANSHFGCVGIFPMQNSNEGQAVKFCQKRNSDLAFLDSRSKVGKETFFMNQFYSSLIKTSNHYILYPHYDGWSMVIKALKETIRSLLLNDRVGPEWFWGHGGTPWHQR